MTENATAFYKSTLKKISNNNILKTNQNINSSYDRRSHILQQVKFRQI